MDDEITKRITLRLPSELHARLQDLADAESRSLNNQLVWLLKLASDPDRLENEQLLLQMRYTASQLKQNAIRLEDALKRLHSPDPGDTSPT